MTHSLVCWKCGASLAALSMPMRRLDICPRCSAELHVCRLCVEYDTSKAKHCREPIAEEVREKDRANFCDFYKPRENAYTPPDLAALGSSRSGLDALFGGGKSDTARPNPAAPATDEARGKLDDLFKPRKP